MEVADEPKKPNTHKSLRRTRIELVAAPNFVGVFTPPPQTGRVQCYHYTNVALMTNVRNMQYIYQFCHVSMFRTPRAPEPPRQPRRQRPSQPHRRRAARPRWLACAPRWAALPLAFALLSPPPPARPLRLLACLAPCAWAPPPVWPLLPAPVPGRVLPLRLRVALACLAPAPSPGGCALLFPGGAVPHAVEGCV